MHPPLPLGLLGWDRNSRLLGAQAGAASMKKLLRLLLLGSFGTSVTACVEAWPLDDLLRLNHAQSKGTHNSYHREPEHPIDDSHRYSHASLSDQLEHQGVRQFELDLHLRANGGLEVFHLPGGLDSETSCRRFTQCLEEIEAWSTAHRDHFPIMIWLEPKDDVDWLDMDYAPLTDEYARIEADIRATLPEDRIIVPDELRGDHDTLREAILAEGWPTLAQTRGRVLFALLDTGAHRDAYLGADRSLAGKLLFVDAATTTADYASVFKINHPAAARPFVEAGFLVTSNVDGSAETDEANRARAQYAFDNGVHYLSSDLPAPTEGRGYWLEIPGGSPSRCNPMTAPEACQSSDIEAGVHPP